MTRLLPGYSVTIVVMTGAFFLGSIFGWVVALAGLAAARSSLPLAATARVAALATLFAAGAFGGGWLFLDWKGGVIAVTGMAAGALLASLSWAARRGLGGHSPRRG
jgi:hypothetical protein